jgi:hypothetical protein
MNAFDSTQLPYSEHPALAEAHRRAWRHIAGPGSVWTGEERVAIAAEVRASRDCPLCAEAKVALSPNSVSGIHGQDGLLSPELRAAVHRITSDPSRLTKDWFDQLVPSSISPQGYVEMLGVLTQVLSIDVAHIGLNLELEPLPTPMTGAASGKYPSQARDEGAWVPLIKENRLGPELAGLYGPMPKTGNVLRALSLVPDEVSALRDLGAAHYEEDINVMNVNAGNGGPLSRPQVELIAARVSSINECFY